MRLFKSLALAGVLLSLALSPTLAAYNGVVHYGEGNAPIGQVVSAGAPAQAITGSTAETILANIKIPAGFAPSNSRIMVRTYWNFTGTAGTKTTKVYLNSSAAIGGTAYLSVAGASGDLSAAHTTLIMNTGTATQIGGLPTGANGRSTAAVLPSGTINMAADSYIVITATNGSAADTATLAGVQVEVLPQ